MALDRLLCLCRERHLIGQGWQRVGIRLLTHFTFTRDGHPKGGELLVTSACFAQVDHLHKVRFIRRQDKSQVMSGRPARLTASGYRFEVKNLDTGEFNERGFFWQGLTYCLPVRRPQFLLQVYFRYLMCEVCFEPLLPGIPCSQLLAMGLKAFYARSG